MKKEFLTYSQYINKLNEGGNAFKELDHFTMEDSPLILSEVRKFLREVLKLNDSDYKVVGSFQKKRKKDLVNDIDVVVAINTLTRFKNIEDSKEVYLEIVNMVVDGGYEYRNSVGIGCVSVKYPIQGKFFQIDILPVNSLDWGTWSYYSPNLLQKESEYKGLYRNAMFEAIAKAIKSDIVYYEEDVNDYIRKGDIKSYYRYRYTRNFGLYIVKEQNEGKRKIIYKKEKSSYRLISDSPDRVVKILLGENTESKNCMTFEDVWKKVSSDNYIYKDLLPEILENYRVIIEDRQKNTLPIEVANYLSGEVEDEYV